MLKVIHIIILAKKKHCSLKECNTRMTPDYDYDGYYIIMLLLCSSYVTAVIKNLELLLLVVMISFKIKFGHTTIILPKISMLMLKTAFINPYISSIQVYSSSNHL